MVTLYFVVPCYNDTDVLPVSAPVFLNKLNELHTRGVVSDRSRLVLLNDGSADQTWETIVSLHKQHPEIIGINLAHNAGEQNALLAGISYSAPHADCVITMDSDLQDDINAVDKMLEAYLAGNDVVLGVRSVRPSDPFFERLSSSIFYRLMETAKTGQVREHSNFRLLSRKAMNLLLEHQETQYFLPCVVSNMGLKRTVVYHERFSRAAGSSGYTVMKKLRLAFSAVMTYSSLPMRFISLAAILCGILFLGSAVYTVVSWKQSGTLDLSLLLLCAMFFLSGLLFAALRVIGEYLYKTFQEARKEPRWQIDEVVDR